MKLEPGDIKHEHESATWCVAIAIYAGWIALTLSFHQLPIWISVAIAAWLICWHGSLQHETIHGHPTKNKLINSLIGYPPLGLVYPYSIYYEMHLEHHRSGALASPFEDNESFYVSCKTWNSLAPVLQTLLEFNNTVVGRLLLGPFIGLFLFATSEMKRIARGDFSHAGAWALHAVLVSALMYWVVSVCGITFWQYVFCFALPGMSLSLLRSFYEHRPAADQKEASAIVEAGLPFQLLFLNNSFHYVHHRFPSLPWYYIRGLYERNKSTVLKENGEFVFKGYSDIIKKYALKPKDSPVFPEAYEPVTVASGSSPSNA